MPPRTSTRSTRSTRPTRRDFLKALGLTAAASALPRAARAAKPQAERPNIVLIMSDDMGFSDIGCYGSEIHTPVLDGLASCGLRFTQFYNTSRCCPTRASLMTGLYPHQAGVGHMMNDRHQVGYEGNLNKHCITIAQAMKTAGYRCYMAGKWHVTRFTAPEGPKDNWPCQRGYDHFYGTIHGAGSYYDPNSLTRDNTQISPYADAKYKPEKFYYTHAISDNACMYIADHAKAHKDTPLFLYVAFTAAHWPMHALAKDIAKYKGVYDGGYGAIRKARLAKARKLGLIQKDWKLSPQAGDWENVEHKEWEIRCMEVYAAMVDCLDQSIGRIVAELEKQGLLDNTLLFFLQDNGGCAEGLGRGARGKYKTRPDKPPFPPMKPTELQRDMIPRQTRDGYPVVMGPGIMPGPDGTYIAYGRNWANVSNTPFREYKHWVHEGGISTPLIVHWPAGIQAKNELRNQPGHLIDIMATCVDVGGANYPAEYKGETIHPMEGRSLRPAFADKPIQREALYWEHEGNRAVRVGKWKLVAKGRGGKWELYDMAADRTELNDLAEKYPDRVKQMGDLWTAYAERTDVLPWPGSGRKGGRNVGSKKTEFTFKKGADLKKEKCPRIAGKTVTVAATVENKGDGVILAQGGSSLGISLYVSKGKLAFAVRRRGALTVAQSKTALPAGTVEVGAVFRSSGKITLTVAGQPAGSANAGGPVPEMPLDGLQVGQDATGAVGDYEAPFPFPGAIDKVTLKLSK